jgi:hypothetical protein
MPAWARAPVAEERLAARLQLSARGTGNAPPLRNGFNYDFEGFLPGGMPSGWRKGRDEYETAA